jgi:alpha-ketoglutarate-dependent taurine dioxygenase
MTKPIKTIEVSSALDAIKKLAEIIDSFKSYGLVLIKGHRFSYDEQADLAKRLGDVFEWNVNSNIEEDGLKVASHVGGQSIDPDKEYNHYKDEYLLDWHIEQVYYVYSPLAGFWCMDKLTCPPGHGNTRFIDSNELFNLLSKEEQDFLSNSMILWDKSANDEVGPFYTKAVDAHPTTKIPIVRIETDGGCYILPTLYSFNGKQVTEEQEAQFQEILGKIKNELRNNETIRYEQEWAEGDFLIVDLFRMYHAVMGGFSYQERIMSMIVANADVEKNVSYNTKPEVDPL